jgi:hypothetical protein
MLISYFRLSKVKIFYLRVNERSGKGSAEEYPLRNSSLFVRLSRDVADLYYKRLAIF